MTNNKQSQAGFSLVELAIVLIIIGLIVGGVLKGQDLVESARVNSIQTQLNEVRVASSTFLNKYDDLPGDITSADAVLVQSGLGSNGDGNGRVGGTGVNRLGATATEPTWFWQHLRAAGLLGGIATESTGVLPATSGLQSRVGGFYTINYETINGITSHWIRLGTTTGAAPTDNNVAVLSPNQLRGIDTKGDDGLPNTGKVGGAGSGTACATGATSTSTYQTTNPDTVACWGHFQL